MKLFQIEEPDGSPVDATAPGVAIGIAVTRELAEVAVAVGGNAVMLGDREGFERDLPAPAAAAGAAAWQELFEGARLRAERALARPVTHAVLALIASSNPAPAERRDLHQAAQAAGLELMRIVGGEGDSAALQAATVAEDLMAAARPE